MKDSIYTRVVYTYVSLCDGQNCSREVLHADITIFTNSATRGHHKGHDSGHYLEQCDYDEETLEKDMFNHR